MMNEKNDANSWFGEFYPVYFSFVGGKKGTEFYHSYKREKPWVWNECGLTFFKLNDDTMKFVIRRHKSIELSYDPKTRGIKNGNAKKNSNLKQKPSQYNLRYFIEFEVPLKNLSSKIETANKALDNYGNSTEKESWLIELDEHHHVWRPKNTDYSNDDLLSNLSKDLEKKKNGSCISDTLSFVTPPSNNNELIPVVCHPARDFNVDEVEHSWIDPLQLFQLYQPYWRD